jgi:UDP-N-acetylglucosamine--N-acetylmuramyl-(pentapeptide) pyrophosphoryl-undecaprenol N-acetylglucosamine transferase
MSAAPILIMAGGTGGHVFPALAVAQALRQRDEDVVWLGTATGLEARIVPAAGIPLDRIRVRGLRRKGILNWLAAPFSLLRSLVEALRVLNRRKPRVVLGMGGFASGPGGLAAWMLRRPLVIHEQNAAAGLTNRLLARIAREVLEAFPGSFSPGVKARSVGNPVRPEIFALDNPEQRLGEHTGHLRVLVLGGSQGALVLNQCVPEALAILPVSSRPEVWHQAGSGTLDAAIDAYRRVDIPARVDAFIDDIASAYDWADVVICRAGALTVSELAAAGLAAVLVPYPSAVDDHQTLNAAFLVNAGAAVLLPQAEFTAERLAEEIERCARDRQLLIDRACAARSLARPNATAELVETCLTVGKAA